MATRYRALVSTSKKDMALVEELRNNFTKALPEEPTDAFEAFSRFFLITSDANQPWNRNVSKAFWNECKVRGGIFYCGDNGRMERAVVWDYIQFDVAIDGNMISDLGDSIEYSELDVHGADADRLIVEVCRKIMDQIRQARRFSTIPALIVRHFLLQFCRVVFYAGIVRLHLIIPSLS